MIALSGLSALPSLFPIFSSPVASPSFHKRILFSSSKTVVSLMVHHQGKSFRSSSILHGSPPRQVFSVQELSRMPGGCWPCRQARLWRARCTWSDYARLHPGLRTREGVAALNHLSWWLSSYSHQHPGFPRHGPALLNGTNLVPVFISVPLFLLSGPGQAIST